MKPVLRLAARGAGAVIPTSLLLRLLGVALGRRHLALCLHRVAERRRSTDRLPELTISAARLDELIELLLASRPGASGWLTVCFDDGYADAAEYLSSRAARFPQVEWLFMICPAKAEHQVGFRWDLVGQRRAPREEARRLLRETGQVAEENQRGELRELARRPEFRLAGVERCLELARLPQVALGNHSNSHLQLSLLSWEQAREELAASVRDFQRLFGRQGHFAIPFGTPGEEFHSAHVALLRGLGERFIWSTEPRPFEPEERRPGAVLPRVAVDGRRSARQSAFLIALQALRYRLLGTPHRYPMDRRAPPWAA